MKKNFFYQCSEINDNLSLTIGTTGNNIFYITQSCLITETFIFPQLRIEPWQYDKPSSHVKVEPPWRIKIKKRKFSTKIDRSKMGLKLIISFRNLFYNIRPRCKYNVWMFYFMCMYCFPCKFSTRHDWFLSENKSHNIYCTFNKQMWVNDLLMDESLYK